MLLDTKDGLHALHREMQAFIRSSAASADFQARLDKKPDPYRQFLRGLRLTKGNDDARLTLDPHGWLILEASADELARCVEKFSVEFESGHIHLYARPVSLIIEADPYWELDTR